jgi:S1-C subfamily serine protease
VATEYWGDCITQGKKLLELAQRPYSPIFFLQLQCHRAYAIRAQQPFPEEYWRLLHSYLSQLIEESKYRPAGIGVARTTILGMVDALEKSGRKTLADDIRQHLAAGESLPQAPSKAPNAASAQVTQVSGTAFAVRPDGYLLTAFHVVKDAIEIEVVCAETERRKALLVKHSEIVDLAVLKIAKGRTSSYLPLADPGSLQTGQRVFTIGFPATAILGTEPKYTEGSLSALSGPGGDASYLQMSVPIQSGNSGGPLVNEAGEVVGIVVATAAALPFLKGTGNLPQNIGWAIKSSLAAPLFKQPARVASDRRETAISRAIKAACHVTVTVPRGEAGTERGG